MSQEPQDVDTRDNAESRVAEGEASQVGTRSSLGGPVFSDARPEGSVPGDDVDAEAGTAGGDPLDGVTITRDDADHAVPGDQGPEHPGRR